MKYDAVIFDLFGTLVDSHADEDYRAAQRRIASVLGVSLDDFYKAWKTTHDDRDLGRFGSLEGDFRAACRVLGIFVSPDQIAEVVKIRVEAYRNVIKVRDDAVPTLIELRTMGHKIGLITCCAWEIPLIWNDLPLAPLTDAVIFSCEEGLLKPDPCIYQLACDQLGVRPERCLYIGDGGSRELTGAQANGMDPLLIRVPYDTKYGPDRQDAIEWTGATVSSLTEILSLVR